MGYLQPPQSALIVCCAKCDTHKKKGEFQEAGQSEQYYTMSTGCCPLHHRPASFVSSQANSGYCESGSGRNKAGTLLQDG